MIEIKVSKEELEKLIMGLEPYQRLVDEELVKRGVEHTLLFVKGATVSMVIK